MGYTHYFTKKQHLTSQQWRNFKSTILLVVQHLPAHSSSGGGYYSSDPLEIFDWEGKERITNWVELFTGDTNIDEDISFNGNERKDLDHESFYIGQTDDLGLPRSCKTARKPYDWLVCTAMAVMHHVAQGCYEFSSDGGSVDWSPVIQWLANCLQQPVNMPVRVENGATALKPDGPVPEKRKVRKPQLILVKPGSEILVSDLYF